MDQDHQDHQEHQNHRDHQARGAREAILTANQQLAALLRRTESVLDGNSEAYRQWARTNASIARYLLDQVVRIAMVGAIKSGKSSLVNALLTRDYLKRGAGVATSIVTRIRPGDLLKARLFLKSWNDINAEIKQALILFPNSQWQTEQHPFDLRLQQDRESLAEALKTLHRDQWIAVDGLNAHSVLLASYLKGYNEMQNFISADSAVLEFDAPQFGEHRRFVGRDALAVFLKDIQLDITGDILSDNIELADCQGSDSPNPLHMAMIQDYLLKAHLIVYVISSRTGVRLADIRFLSMIKRMGISDNMLFVCNCDFNEHDALPEMQTLVLRVQEELALVVPDPQLFAFSALYHLFRHLPADDLSDRDQAHLAQWRKATDMIQFSDGQAEQFKYFMRQKYTSERSALLLKNQMERMVITASGLSHWIGLNRELRQGDRAEAHAVAQRLHEHQRNVSQIQSMIQSALAGAVDKLKKDLRKDCDRFFDRHYGPVLTRLLGFINEYQVDISVYEAQLDSVGFAHCLYGVFQEFKQAMDIFVTESVTPEIMGFARNQERRLVKELQTVAKPFEAMTWQSLSQYREILDKLDTRVGSVEQVFNGQIDFEEIKEASGIAPPHSAAVMSYSAGIKTEAILRLGVYNVVRFLRKVVRKPVGPDTLEGAKALKDGVRRIKNETQRSVLEFYKSFKENFKFQYLFPLADLAAERLSEILVEQLIGYTGNLKELVNTVEGQRDNKAQMDEALGVIETDLNNLQQQLDAVRSVIDDLARLHSVEKKGLL